MNRRRGRAQVFGRWYCTGWIAILILSLCQGAAAGQYRQSPDAVSERALSERLRSARITVVRFLPIPRHAADGFKPHERIFTDEFYTAEPTSPKVHGMVVPSDYLEIIDDTLQGVAASNRLKVTLADGISDVHPGLADFIVLGSVGTFSGDNGASVSFTVRLLDGHRLTTLTDRTIQNGSTTRTSR